MDASKPEARSRHQLNLIRLYRHPDPRSMPVKNLASLASVVNMIVIGD